MSRLSFARFIVVGIGLALGLWLRLELLLEFSSLGQECHGCPVLRPLGQGWPPAAVPPHSPLARRGASSRHLLLDPGHGGLLARCPGELVCREHVVVAVSALRFPAAPFTALFASSAFLVRIVCSQSCPLKTPIVYLLNMELHECLSALVLCPMHVWPTFAGSVLPVSFLNVPFEEQKFLVLMKSTLSISE